MTTMNNVSATPLSETVEIIHSIIQNKGSITLSDLESETDMGFNLIFLAIDNLARENKIKLIKTKDDYILSRFH